MTQELHLEVLGGLHIGPENTADMRFVSTKAPALLCYLAVTGRPHFRASLAALLWSELPEAAARMNLRHVLSNLRRLLAPHLIITRETVAFDRSSPYWLDIEQFEAALHGAAPTDVEQLRAAVTLYKGDFLEGFYVREAPAFDEWAMAQRERLRQLVLNALHELVSYYTSRQEYAAGIDYATRLLQLDPWREDAHRQLMLLLALSGQPSAALQQYDTCCRILDEELGAEPDAETTALREQIRTGVVAPRPVLPPRRRNLPIPHTLLVGRERELTDVRQLLRPEGARPSCRLLTLAGPAGVGKTRLALAVAAQQQADFADGVCFVELATIRDPALVPNTIAQALGVRETADQPMLEGVKAWLQHKHLLLCLDNFEHILPATPLVSELLASCPRLTVVVTSRAMLRVRGEQEFVVPPLPVPDPANLPTPTDELVATLSRYAAVDLFIQRAANVKSDFTITQKNAMAVAEICYHLDGLPLAIELAAARLKLFSPQGVLARLSSRLTLLAGGAQDLPIRQQTLRAAIASSYELLDTDEQALFRRLAVFVGGFTLDAAESVIREPGAQRVPVPSVIDGVASLLDHSLLRQVLGPDGEPRWTMLETIREYAVEQLRAVDGETGEDEAAHHSYAAFYLGIAEAGEPEVIRGAHQVSWYRRLEAEHDNLRAALHWAIARSEAAFALRLATALYRFWLTRGHLSEGRRWLLAALQLAGPVPPALRAKALQGAGWLAANQRDYREATVLLEQSLALAREQQDWRRVVEVLGDLGQTARLQGDLRRANMLFEESLALAKEQGDLSSVEWSLSNLGHIAHAEGDNNRAERLLEASVRLARELGGKVCMGWSLNFLGRVAKDQRRYRGAADHLAESLALFRELDYRDAIAFTLEAFAGLATAAGPYPAAAVRAAQLFGAAEVLREAIGSPMAPVDRPEYEQDVAAARAHLDEAAFEVAWREGRAMPLETVIAVALDTSPSRHAAPV